MEVALTNLSNDLFVESRKTLNQSALKFGISTIFSYDFQEIANTDFYVQNSTILSQPTGIGYWLWKPFIILEALKKVADGDIVIYADCGIEIIHNLKPLIDLCANETNIVLFANSSFANKLWTKRDCFILMDCDEPKYWDGTHCDAAFGLFRKCDATIKFLNQWFYFCTNINILTDIPNVGGKHNLPAFLEHRRDQSILSLLAIKHNVSLYRMPTQFGNHYKLPQYRVANEFNCLNQADQKPLNYYSIIPFANSRYFQLLNHHREKTRALDNRVKLISKGTVSLSSLNFKHFIKKSFQKLTGLQICIAGKNENPNQKISFAQCGEDLIVQYVFKLRGIAKPTYMDIGANHPFYLSNTALFYQLGSRGINIDANPPLMENFKNYRKDDINLNIGIGDKEEVLDFYLMEDNTLSTFSKSESEAMVKAGKPLAEIKKISLTTISEILSKYFKNQFPDFLSLDTEGMDFEILQSINFTHSGPKVICVESAEFSPTGSGLRRSELIDFLVTKGYYEYANTNLNAIMVKRDFWFI